MDVSVVLNAFVSWPCTVCSDVLIESLSRALFFSILFRYYSLAAPVFF